jgi:flagellar motility protein MotE (MotC chaperone)
LVVEVVVMGITDAQTLIGAILGFLLGIPAAWYFYRKQAKATELENRKLREDVKRENEELKDALANLRSDMVELVTPESDTSEVTEEERERLDKFLKRLSVVEAMAEEYGAWISRQYRLLAEQVLQELQSDPRGVSPKELERLENHIRRLALEDPQETGGEAGEPSS